MGDFFARDLGLGHVKGLPILALILAVIFLVEHRDRFTHQAYYWLVIIVVRTAATNLADFAAGDMRLDKASLLAVLTVLLALIVFLGRFFAPAGLQRKPGNGLPVTDAYYWMAMLAAGTLGTVLGDISSFGSGLGTGRASIGLCALLGTWFYFGRGWLGALPCYWLTIVLVRTAGTAVGDYLAGRSLGLGLPLSTACTGLLFVAILMLWKEARGLPPGADRPVVPSGANRAS